MKYKANLRQYEKFLIAAFLTVSLVLIVSPAFSQTEELTVKTDKSSYSAGEIIKVSGTLPEAAEPMPVIIQVFNPDNSTYTTVLPAPNSDGTFSFEFAINGTIGIDGTYRVRAIYSGQSQETIFEFKGEVPQASNNTVVTFSGGSTHSIDANLSNGVISAITANEESTILILSIRTIGNEVGNLTVVLPREIIDAKFEQQDDAGIETDDDRFIVLVDGDYADYTEMSSTPMERTLHISILAGTQEVQIGGTSIMPEFGFVVPLVLATAVAIMVLLSRKGQILKGIF